jgi:hypothetical protein
MLIGLRSRLSFALIACSAPLPAQTSAIQQSPPRPVTPPKQLSFTAEIKNHRVQTLADGTIITTDDKETVARDSQGRMLNASTRPLNLSFPPQEESPITTFHVNDPVEDTEITWNSRTPKAIVRKMPSEKRGCWLSASGLRFRLDPSVPPQMTVTRSPLARSSQPPTGSSANMATSPNEAGATPRKLLPELSSQDLGVRIIMGLEAHGTRRTVTTPAGAIGNDRPLVQTREMWFATGMMVPLLQTSTDPRSGIQTSEVVSLNLSEPPLSTFRPPAGYQIENDEVHEIPCPD